MNTDDRATADGEASPRETRPARRRPLFYAYGQAGGASSPVRVSLQTVAFFGAMILLIGLGGGLYLQQSAEVASYAHEIRVLERDKERLHRQIVALRGQVAMKGSLQRVLEESDRLGYRLPPARDTAQRLRIELDPLDEIAPGAMAHAAQEEWPPRAPQRLEESDGRLGALLDRWLQPLQEWIAAPPADDGW